MTHVNFRECHSEAIQIPVVDENVKLQAEEGRVALNAYKAAMESSTPNGYRHALENVTVRMEALLASLADPRDVIADCPFAGDVEIHESGPPGDRILQWTCPVCDTERTERD